MTFSDDVRWCAIKLYNIMGLPMSVVSDLLGISQSTLTKWSRHFDNTGNVHVEHRRKSSSRWPPEVLTFVESYTKSHPCFILEELQEAIKQEFPQLQNIAVSTVCRALRRDLNLSRKKLRKRARESNPEDMERFQQNIKELYHFPELLVLRTSKDRRASLRSYAYSTVNTPTIVNVPFSRGIRVSAKVVSSGRPSPSDTTLPVGDKEEELGGEGEVG